MSHLGKSTDRRLSRPSAFRERANATDARPVPECAVHPALAAAGGRARVDQVASPFPEPRA